MDIQSPEGISEPSVKAGLQGLAISLAKASGKMTLDDGKELFEETDTHFGCDDGIAACLRRDSVHMH